MDKNPGSPKNPESERLENSMENDHTVKRQRLNDNHDGNSSSEDDDDYPPIEHTPIIPPSLPLVYDIEISYNGDIPLMEVVDIVDEQLLQPPEQLHITPAIHDLLELINMDPHDLMLFDDDDDDFDFQWTGLHNATLQCRLNKLYKKYPNLFDDYGNQASWLSLIQLCHERANIWSEREASIEATSDVLIRLKQWFDSHDSELDWSNPIMRCLIRFAIMINDQAWVRIFIEYGADITELDQGCIYDMVFTSPHARSMRWDKTRMIAEPEMPLLRLLVEIIDINLNYFYYETIFQDFLANTFNLQDIKILQYLLQSVGQLPDVVTALYNFTTPTTLQNSPAFRPFMKDHLIQKFLCVILSNDLLAPSNIVIFDRLKSQSLFYPLNLAERQMILGNRETPINSFPIKFVGGIVHGLLGIANPPCGDELILLLIDKFVIPIEDRSWMFTQPMDASIIMMMLQVCAKEGYLDSLKLLLQITDQYYAALGSSDANSNPMLPYQEILDRTYLSCRSLTTFRYLIEETNVNIHSLFEFHGNMQDILFYLCTKIVPSTMTSKSRGYDVKDSVETIFCIQYLAEKTAFSISDSILSPNNYLISDLIARRRYRLIDAIAKWSFGYQMEISSQNGKSSRCVNINDCLINCDDIGMNLLSYCVLTTISRHKPLFQIIDYLVKHHKADVNAIDSNGDTILIYLIRSLQYKSAKQLVIDYHADVRIKNNQGESAESLYVNDEIHFGSLLRMLQNNNYCQKEKSLRG